MKFYLLLYVSFLTISNILCSMNKTNKKCRALALEGGGDAGAWEAGVIYGLIYNLPEFETQYDVITGVSVGSLNGFYYSSHKKGEEKILADKIVKIWSNLSWRDIYENWSWGYLGMFRAFWDKPSLFNNEPLKKMILNETKNKSIKRKFTVGVSDASNNKILTYDLDKYENQTEIAEIIVDSTRMPFIFPYKKKDGKILVDGGVLQNLDVKDAIRRCREIVDSDEDIIIDTIMPTGVNISKLNSSKSSFLTGWEMYRRYKSLVNYKNVFDDIFHAKNDFSKALFRYIIYPLNPIPSNSIPIAFNKNSMRKMIKLGIEDAKRFINKTKLI